MNLLFSVDENQGIGKKKDLLFRIAPDMRAFREKTVGGAVIMGRKTFESLPDGKPLNDRVNIVLTRNPEEMKARLCQHPHGSHDLSELILCQSLAELSASLQVLPCEPNQVWVIGGGEVFRLLAPYCRQAYVTRILTVDREADCWMEDLGGIAGWYLAEAGEIAEWQGIRYQFVRYVNDRVEKLPSSLVLRNI